MTMTREEIIQKLIEKSVWWFASDLRNSTYNNLETNSFIPRFNTERDDNGYFYISDSLVSYCDLRTGKIFRIRRYWEEKDWNCYNQLYQKGLEQGFRIDIPLHKEIVTVLENEWEYVELVSPGNDYGKNYNDDVFTWPELTDGLIPNTGIDDAFRQSVKEYYIEFVDQVTVIISAAKNIAIENMCGLPLGLSYIFNRYRDDQGFFWSDFDHFTWTRTGSDVLADSMLYLKGTLVFAVICGVITEQQGIEVENHAREKWAAI
jgi:hypothetical protein